MKGLRNLGSTCYANAALQCLIFSPALANYFTSGTYKSDAARKRANASALCDEFANIVYTYWKTDDTPDPRAFLERFAKIYRNFNTNIQHDAHEFLQMVLTGLHSGLAKTKKFAAPSDVSADTGAWAAHNAAHGYSFFTEVLQSQVAVTIDGKTHHEHDWGFSLAVDSVSSVAAALSRDLGEESVSATTGTNMHVTRRLVHSPLVLMLHLKRFDNSSSKIEKFVDYGTELGVPASSARYALYGVVCHSGDSGSGHYWSMCEIMGRWFRVDDETSTQIDDVNAVITRDAYMLFYKRVC